MKSCIYQKQEPVNIPQAETRTLKDVLELPWGFEIYWLLTRWNPLEPAPPYPQPPTGKRVLVVGMGPAGFTLAHHLMNDGHTVVGVDGLKIEPLAAAISGVDAARRAVQHSSRFASRLSYTRRWTSASWPGSAASPNTASRSAGTRTSSKIIRLLLERRRAVRACSAVCASAAR